jgi:HSP20 family molecular chaperone IbpA
MSTETTMRKRDDYAEALDQRPRMAPAVDIYENADEVLLVADLPGVDKDSIDIRLEKGELTIEGKRRKAPEGSALAAEFRSLDFRRAFLVPRGINPEGIAADMANGVLRVHLPKAAALKPRQITVKAS